MKCKEKYFPNLRSKIFYLLLDISSVISFSLDPRRTFELVGTSIESSSRRKYVELFSIVGFDGNRNFEKFILEIGNSVYET